MDDFHLYFKARLVTRIAECFGRSKSKIFQGFAVPPDPTCITHQSRKILMFFFVVVVPSDSYLAQAIMSKFTSFSTPFTKPARYYNSKKEKSLHCNLKTEEGS